MYLLFLQSKSTKRIRDRNSFNKASKIGLIGNRYFSVEQALNSAKEKAKQEDLIFIGGSTFVVSEVL